MRISDSRILWLTDADNTLWDTNAVFAEAQLGLLGRVEAIVDKSIADGDRLSFVREIDQSIAASHHRGLRYSAELLAQGLAHRLSGRSLVATVKAVAEGKPVGDPLQSAASDYLSALQGLPRLRPGVIEGFRELTRLDATIVVVTEGSRARIEQTLKHFDLLSRVRSCVEAPKLPQFYKRLAKAYAREVMWMVGDQLDKDIVPASAAGFHTIYFPGAFTPRWHRQRDVAHADAVVNDYNEAVIFATNSVPGGVVNVSRRVV